jgi:hypothetical protein
MSAIRLPRTPASIEIVGRQADYPSFSPGEQYVFKSRGDTSEIVREPELSKEAAGLQQPQA